MGFRVSWLACRGRTSSELLSAAGFALTGERGADMDVGFYLVEGASGDVGPWSMIVADGSDYFAELEVDVAPSLSKNAEVLYFWCSDTTMNSELLCFRDGDLAWAVHYDCEDASKRPLLAGKVPEFVREIASDLQETQRESDEAGDDVDHVYDLTKLVGRKLTGFQHDSDPGTSESAPFQVLQRNA